MIIPDILLLLLFYNIGVNKRAACTGYSIDCLCSVSPNCEYRHYVNATGSEWREGKMKRFHRTRRTSTILPFSPKLLLFTLSKAFDVFRGIAFRYCNFCLEWKSKVFFRYWGYRSIKGLLISSNSFLENLLNIKYPRTKFYFHLDQIKSTFVQMIHPA